MPHIIVIKNNKLKEMYDINYYEVIPNKDFTNLSFMPKNDIEKIIRIIPIKDNDKFKSNKLKLRVITINLSNIRSTEGTQLYKNIFKTSRVPTQQYFNINIYININYYMYSNL